MTKASPVATERRRGAHHEPEREPHVHPVPSHAEARHLPPRPAPRLGRRSAGSTSPSRCPRLGQGQARAVGCQQQLTWKLRRLPGQTVTFVDRSGKLAAHAEDDSSASTGRSTFTPLTAAAGAHKIVGDGLPAGNAARRDRRRPVRRPNGTGRVDRLTARRKGSKTTVTWNPVCAAVLLRSDGHGIGKTSRPSRRRSRRRDLGQGAAHGHGRRRQCSAGQTGKPSTITIH